MDQSTDLAASKKIFDIDIEVPSLIHGSEKKKVARRRWAILAKALKSPAGSQPSSPTDEISVRRISSFMLLETQELSTVPAQNVTPSISKRTWFKYSISIDGTEFFLNVGHRNRTFSAEDLMGFNNTGNVCIWPSEETLTYYVCSNISIFDNKTVLELGGGMSCLAGLFVAKYGQANKVLVTDGNKTSIENVDSILECNVFSCPTRCAILKWADRKEKYDQFDLIISADCLFFDDARADFITSLENYLAKDGMALVMAPQRGTTLDSFILQSEARGFSCRKVMKYNDVVWQKRLALLGNCEYDDNIHYPILIESRDFHENGKKHKENVKKRLKAITKDSAKAQQAEEKADEYIRQMEVAALAAYKKDVESNADLTSIAINQKLQEENLTINKADAKKVWHELQSQDGNTYYWNTLTNETKWEAPEEGYLSISEQGQETEKERKKQALLRLNEEKKEDEEDRARVEREKLKERRVKEITPPPVYGPVFDTRKSDAYGKWETLQEREPVIDLQLPETSQQYECPVIFEPEPLVKEFKEKTVECLQDNESRDSYGFNFKKRKIPTGARRNTRQRLDND